MMEEAQANISQDPPGDRAWRREQTDLLCSRLYLLDGEDRVMMTMSVVNGNSIRQIARLRGVSEAIIARRIYGLTKRLTDGHYIRCLRNRDKFTALQMAVAKDYFLRGLSMKRIAVERRWSWHRVCRTLNEIRRLIKDCE